MPTLSAILDRLDNTRHLVARRSAAKVIHDLSNLVTEVDDLGAPCAWVPAADLLVPCENGDHA